MGGFGGGAGNASTVNLTVLNPVTTQGTDSSAVVAQSIGGGGGNGGFSVSASGSGSGEYSGSLSASLGGFGGSAGHAGAVTSTVTGEVMASLENSAGVVAQSIGGGGGKGGFSASGNFVFGKQANGAVTASVGGKGGAGGTADTVTLTRVGATTTTGDNGYGLLAQSIGGGGGDGGLSISGSIGGPDSKQVAASVGGFGGTGSHSGAVSVTNTGAITTGTIATSTQQVAEEGTVTQEVKVVTGKNADGILAQSIGGGGGNGGFSFSGTVGPTGENTNVNVGLTVGGFGGGGGYADSVTVANTGLVTTSGHQAMGIRAQSIGGGGGNGGSAVTGLLAAGDSQKGRAVNVAVSVGGLGGDGNVSGEVIVSQKGGITTNGAGSHGILAQSIGGGGGTGGGANSLSLQLATSCTWDGIPGGYLKVKGCKPPAKPSVNVQVDVGGGGGKGNNASNVTVTNDDFISTHGEAASGILAQSIGGGGGNGGQAIVGLDGLFPGASYVDTATTVATLPIGTSGIKTGFGKVTVGGFGGASGNGKAVAVTNHGEINTYGDSAYGIYAESVGGGGGIGGDAASGVTGLFSLGGFGGASGNGGDVTVLNYNRAPSNANITTRGSDADAIFAHSVGGGGGSGGSAGGVLALGGFEAAGGDGGAVNVRNSAKLATRQARSNGILAQSVGGGGGKGGSTGLSVIAIGGKGGNGGKGGKVQVTNTGEILTEGADSMGIFAQSIGGSGGIAGSTKASAITVGRVGGSGGDGGEASVDNQGAIRTNGDGSHAVFTQSVGGGGGAAGGIGDTVAGIGIISVGSSGGGAGNGGRVSVDNSGTLSTTGGKAHGVFAQSVGGGGGTGGRAIGVIAVGGSGGSAGHGGEVSVNNKPDATINVKGSLANGITAQSIGGGGGDAGGAYSGSPLGFSISVGGSGSGGGNGGLVSVENKGGILTEGPSSQGIFAQSVGGGGGNGSIAGSFNTTFLPAGAIAVSVGGKGGIGGHGGAVSVTNKEGGTIGTKGESSTAIFAQSVGGGGGVGGGALGLSIALPGSATVAVGGGGGAGGDGGAVTVENDNAITISGNNSVGILAQSVGGGGGTASSALGIAVIPVFIGGDAGATGKGGDVSVINKGTITIDGSNSIGIFAQSVGGGGGLVRPGGGASSVIQQSGGNGNGGIVTINNDAGQIIVNGANSVALYSQSVGGGGGAVGVNAASQGLYGAFQFSRTAGGHGSAQDTVVNQTGNLIATGENSAALLAQSNAVDGEGDITVNIKNKSADNLSYISGGTGNGAGVVILNGKNNTVNNEGVVTSLHGIDGYALRSSTGADAFNNHGILIGSAEYGTGRNFLNNRRDGVAIIGDTINLGNGTASMFLNEGLLSPGGERTIRSNVTGGFTQTDSGRFETRLDFINDGIDRLDVSEQASLKGRLEVQPINIASIKPGKRKIVFVEADGGITDFGMSLSLPSTIIAKYAIKANENQAYIRANVDFASFGNLNRNQTAIGNYFNRIQAAGSAPAMATLVNAIYPMDKLSDLKAAYNGLSPEIYTSTPRILADASQLFINNLMSCKVAGGDHRFISEGQCAWFNVSAQKLNTETTYEQFGFTSSIVDLSAGMQWNLGQNWYGSISVGRGNYATNFSDTVEAQLNGFTNYAGVALKKVVGGTKFALAFVSGFGDFNYERYNVFPSSGLVKGYQDTSVVASALRVSHDVEYRNWYWRPLIDFSLARANYSGFNESGDVPISLRVKGGSFTTTTLTPGLEIGGEFKDGPVVFRPRIGVGYSRLLSNPSATVTAEFNKIPRSFGTFDVRSDMDTDFLDATADLDLIFANGMVLKLGYLGQFSANSNSHGGQLRFSIPF
jgi:hypothetical protein